MTKTICLHDKTTIEDFLRQDPILHLFALGDLDDFFWPYTGWYALKDNDEVRQLVLTYTDAPTMVLMALAHERIEEMRDLLRSILHLLPQQIYVHLSEGLVDVLASAYEVNPQGRFLKMALTDFEHVAKIKTTTVAQLTNEDSPDIEQFFQESYPQKFFNARMLQTGQYFGIRQNNKLVGTAGIHVYSPDYGVAVLGNIATHPTSRRQGIATATTARLCQSLRDKVDHIGLIVLDSNTNAIDCYTKLGFIQHSVVEVYTLESKC